MTDKIKKVENTPMKLEVSSPIVIDCKYYLPCGRCDKTNGFCSQLDAIYQQTKPNVTVRTTPNEYSANQSFYIPVNNDGVKPV